MQKNTSSFRDSEGDADVKIPIKRLASDRGLGAKKKAKLTAKKVFFDVSASSCDEDASECLEEAKEAMRYKQESLNPKLLETTPEELADHYSELARPTSLKEKPSSVLDKQSRLPSIKDPKLWIIRCRKKMERQAVIALMFKSIGQPNEIFSVFCSDHVEMAIYIEAYKKVDILEAVRGLSFLYSGTLKIIPIKEMANAFNMEKVMSLPVTEGSFVRLKYGLQKGDLAQVVCINRFTREVQVKVVPRMGANVKKGVKPDAKLFNPSGYKGADVKPDPDTGHIFCTFRGNSYTDGFLIKTLKLENLIYENVRPLMSEITPFTLKDDARLRTKPIARKANYAVGDKVKVVTGDLKNLVGTVFSVAEHSLTIIPSCTDMQDTKMEFGLSEVAKCFEVGDSVQIMQGRYEGLKGIIATITSRSAQVLSSDKKVLEVLCSDLRLSGQAASCKLEANYRINDIVKMNDGSFGLVQDTLQDRISIFQASSDKENISCEGISNKFQPCRASSTDVLGNTLKAKDVVKVKNSEHPLYGRVGTVVNCLKGVLYIYMPHEVSANKIFAVKAAHCMLAGAGNGLGSKESDGKMVGKLVLLKHGPYRSKKGTVEEVDGTRILVSLDSERKKVLTDLGAVEVVDFNKPAPAASGKQASSSTPSLNFGTPIREPASPLSQSTPHNSWWGARPPSASRN